MGYIESSYFVHPNGLIEFALLTGDSCHWPHLGHLVEHKLLSDFKLKLKAFEDICYAIQHCHSHNIAHLQIHPTNILQDGFGTFKIGNFDSSIIISNGMNGTESNFRSPYSRNSIFPNLTDHDVDDHRTSHTLIATTAVRNSLIAH